MIKTWSPIEQALLGTCFTWFVTALGSVCAMPRTRVLAFALARADATVATAAAASEIAFADCVLRLPHCAQAVVFLEPILPGGEKVHRKFLDGMLGFAGGVMMAASYWSLLAPAISMSEQDWYGEARRCYERALPSLWLI